MRACLYLYGRLGHTALSLKCKYYHYQWYSCLMEGKGSEIVGEGGLGCNQALVTKIPPYMVQNVYSERELSIKLLFAEKKI